jgi:hypothetical protein
MTLLAGDLTTQARVATWMSAGPTPPSSILQQLIGSMTALIYGKLNRARLYSQIFTRIFDGVGNMQIVLPDWPVTKIVSVQQGAAVIPLSVLPMPNSPQPSGTNPGYGYRYVPWQGNLPGDPAVIEFVGGFFYTRPQNVKITYQAGYAVSDEPWTVPAISPWQVTVLQQQGIWSRDGGVVYADTGVALVPVATGPTVGQYIPPTDANPGLYTFAAADAGAAVLISYSFIPADLEEACIQMVAERYTYRSRVGVLSQSLGGQETMRYLRGGAGRPWSGTSSLPPEVMDLIWPYCSVTPPAIGAPV